MDWPGFWAELKGWQALIGAVAGFGALTWGAHYNFRLNRKRDDRIREMEGLTVALALYSEIKLLRHDIASLAKGLSAWFLRAGHRSHDLPKYFLETSTLREPNLYTALAPKIGLLPPQLLLQVTAFYSNYLEAKAYLPKLVEDETRMISYGVEWVLRPAMAAVEDVVPALRTIEVMGQIAVPADDPCIGKTRQALALEAELRPDPD